MSLYIVESERVIFFDVDETLVMWGKIKRGQKAVHVTDPYTGAQETLRPHKGHIKVLKTNKARGAYIIVWSAGGHRWAKAVVKALNLDGYVDAIMSKPVMYVDDCEASDILGQRLYLGKDSPYGG